MIQSPADLECFLPEAMFWKEQSFQKASEILVACVNFYGNQLFRLIGNKMNFCSGQKCEQVLIVLNISPRTEPAIKILWIVSFFVVENIDIRMCTLFKDLILLRKKNLGMRILSFIRNEKASKQDQERV